VRLDGLALSSVAVRLLVLAWLLLACSDPGSDEPPSQAPPPARVTDSNDAPAQPEALETPSQATQPPAEPTRPSLPYRCRVPALPIPRSRACVRGQPYPRCKWQMPHATLAGGRYRRWRNTVVEHWWGRPALVSLILAAADEFERAYPEQVLAVGDLDAPGPRHSTHDRGVDVDLYLLGAMRVENAGGGRYPNNYEGKSEAEVEELRSRVETLARILAACTNGQVRIYYNDEAVIDRFLAWYDAQGFRPNDELGRPMQAHNRLHEFHFHVTVPEDLPLLEREPLTEGRADPIAPIEPPPPPNSAPHLSSMNRRPGDWAAVPRE